MPNNVTPVDTFPANLLVAADGDAVNNTIRLQVQQTYADAITYIRNRAVPTGTLAQEISRAAPALNGSTAFVFTAGIWTEAVGSGDTAIWPVQLPPVPSSPGSTLRLESIDVWTINTTGHGGLAPANQQSLTLRRTNASAGTNWVSIASFADTSTGAQLDTLHRFSSAAAINLTPVPGDAWWVEYIGESGANAQPDTDIHNIIFNWEWV